MIRWPFRPKPLSEEERDAIRWALLAVSQGWVATEDDLSPAEIPHVRLALRHDYLDDGTAGLPFYRITRKGRKFLQEHA